MPNAEPLFHVESREEQNLSPYAMPYKWKLSNARAASAGFAFSPIRKSIAGMVQESMAPTGHWNKRLQHLNIYETAMGEAWQLIKNPYPVG